MRKFTVMIALLLVVALATPAIGASFPDVPSNHWAYEAINKLVAAGVIEGYPDGTYKGQRNLTRYEIAMIVSRVMDNMAEERAELLDKVESMEKKDSGLTSEQAQDVTAIVKALIEKNMPEEPEPPKELTDEQADQVVNLIEALTFEYKAELKVLRSDFDDISEELGLLQDDVVSIEERVTDLEDETPPVTFSGSYSVDFTHKDIIEDSGVWYGSYGLDHYYIEDAPLSEYDDDNDYELSTSEYQAYVQDVAGLIEERMIDLRDEGDFAAVADYYNDIFDPATALEAEDIGPEEVAEIAVFEYNDAIINDSTNVPGSVVGTEIVLSDTPFGDDGYELADYRVQEETSLGADYLPMWSTLGSDAVAFTEETSLTHTLKLNADIDYAGFEGQAGIELEKLDATDEVTFKSADFELENDTLVMNYNEENEFSYADFAVDDETFNAASFLYKPWGLNTFVAVDEVVTGYEDPLDNLVRGDEELNAYWADRDLDDEYDLFFDGDEVPVTADYIVTGAQKTFVLDMADVKVTAAGRKHPDWNTEKYFESLVVGAEAEAELDMFDLSGDVAMSTAGEFEDYGYMFRADASADLMDAFTVSGKVKNRGEGFSPLYGDDSIYAPTSYAAYDKYGVGLGTEEMLGYGIGVEHDGSSDEALVAGLDLGFNYDSVGYGGTDSDTRIGADASMDVMEGLTVEGSYTQLSEPTGLETLYYEDTVLYSVGATFTPVENAEVSGEYSVVDPVEETLPTTDDDGEEYKAVNETTMGLSGSYDLNDYVGVEGSYTQVKGLDNYEDGEMTTTTVGGSLTDYPIMSGLTGSASVEYSSVTGEAFNDVEEVYNAEHDFNEDAILDNEPYLSDLSVTKTTLKGGLDYTLSEKTSLSYDLVYAMQSNADDNAYQYNGTYMENALGLEYTFTEDADLTADYKNMRMNYDGTEDVDWSAHQFEAGVSVSF